MIVLLSDLNMVFKRSISFSTFFFFVVFFLTFSPLHLKSRTKLLTFYYVASVLNVFGSHSAFFFLNEEKCEQIEFCSYSLSRFEVEKE